MVRIKAGTFIMGSPETEVGRGSDEEPHEVTITKDCYIGQYEVTQAQYETVMNENPSKYFGDDVPVHKVSWRDAMEFCQRLNQLTENKRPEGYEYTLPTEAQWEYACRAGTTTGLNNGRELTGINTPNEALDEVAWHYKNSEKGLYQLKKGKAMTYQLKGTKRVPHPHPVGELRPNAWGLYDMHGNVLEWCRDWYVEDIMRYTVDPLDPSRGSNRVQRGGGWFKSAKGWRSAQRHFRTPLAVTPYIGFRLALAPIPEPEPGLSEE